MRRCAVRLRLRFRLRLVLAFLLVWIAQLANCLPIVDPGAGYCLLGLDCTLDEDFLPDDQGGHCDGLRSAFTPSAHFICCRYNAANRTMPHLPSHANMGQNVADNDLAPFGDYADTLGPDGDVLSGGDFVQNVESPALQTDGTGAATTTDVSYSPTSDAMKSEELTAQDDALQSIRYTTEMFTDIYTTTENILRSTEALSSKHSDAAVNTQLKSEEYSAATETSATQIATQVQNQGSSADSGLKVPDSVGDRDESVVGNSQTQSDNESSKSDNSSWKDEQVELQDDLDGTQGVRGVMVAQPSVVSARTGIVMHADKARHRNVEIKNRDISTSEAATQTTYYTAELPASVEGGLTAGDGMVANTVSHTDIITESYSAVTVSETGTEETVPSYVDNMANTSLQRVFERTVLPITDPRQGPQDTTTVMGSQSGVAPSKLYGDTKLLHESDQRFFVDTGEYSGYQTNSWASVVPTELDNSLGHSVTETLISATQNFAASEDDVINTLHDSEFTDSRQAPEKEPDTAAESSRQHFLTQSFYEDTARSGVKVVSSELDERDALSQPSGSVLEMSNNTLNFSEISNKIAVTIPYTFTPHETRNLSAQTVTSSKKEEGTKPGYVTNTVSQKESDTTTMISALRKHDSFSNVLPKTTEDLSVMRKPVHKEVSATDHSQKPELSGLHEINLSVYTDEVSVQTDQVDSSRTITEHVSGLGTQQLNEITTEFLTSKNKTTVSPIKGTLEPASSSSVEATRQQEKSSTENVNQATVFLGEDGESPDNAEKVTELIPKGTIIHSEIIITAEATRVLPVVSNKEGSSSPSSTVDSSGSFSIMESSNSSTTIGSSISTSMIPDVTVPIAGEQSPPCGEETSGNFHGSKCWLVQFVNPYSGNSSVCVGSYLDSHTIVTSASCLSRVFDIGVARVTLHSAGGAVTEHTMIRDVIVHEEYRSRGMEVQLNDIGLVRLNPDSHMPPAACALCLPKSDHDLLDKLCSKTSLSQVKPKLMPLDTQIGSPMVCSGGVLAGVASYHNPHPVYTPVSDYVTWIRDNQETHNPRDDWK